MPGLLRVVGLSVLVAVPLVVLQTGCKKKPKGSADGGAAATTGAAGATTPTPPQTGVQSGEGVVSWKIAQLRAAPGDKAGAALATLTEGTRVLVLERRDGWSRVRPIDGKTEGWVLSQSIEGGVVLGGRAPGAAVAAVVDLGTIRIDKPTVNLRNTANGKKVIAKLQKGASLRILRDEGDWLLVEGDGKKGWVARKVVTVLAAAKLAAPPVDRASAAVAPVPAATPGGPALGTAKVRWSNINLREKPDGKIIDKVAKNSHLTVLATQPKWLKIRTDDGRSGWLAEAGVERLAAAKAAVDVAPAAPSRARQPNNEGDERKAGTPSRVTWAKVFLRASPPAGAILKTLPRGTQVEILATQGKFHRVRVGDVEGFVAVRAVEKVSGAAARAPTSAPRVETAPAREETAVKAAARSAANVRETEPVDEGDGAERTAPAANAPVKQIVYSAVNLRESPKGTSIGKLARGTRVREIESEEKWVKVQTVDQSHTGWVIKRAVGRVN